ncbi:hypothetical protein ACSTEM_22975, partial [Vibrio vulnificus]
REARSEKREARSEKREARSEKREARSEKRENFEGSARSANPFSLNSDNEIQIRNQCCLQLLALSPRSHLEERSSLADSLSEAFSKEVKLGSLFPYLTIE